MTSKLVETTISETTVRLRYANENEAAKSTEWIDIQVPLAELLVPHTHQPTKIGNPEPYFVAEVRLAALHYVRDVIGAEIQRLGVVAGRNR
jgi:hypothetical protein